MNVNATIDGEAVVIVGMTIERYRALVAYIDTQAGAGDLIIKSINLTDLDADGITIASSAQHN